MLCHSPGLGWMVKRMPPRWLSQPHALADAAACVGQCMGMRVTGRVIGAHVVPFCKNTGGDIRRVPQTRNFAPGKRKAPHAVRSCRGVAIDSDSYDERYDRGAACPSDSCLCAAPARWQPPAAVLFPGRRRHRGTVPGHHRPCGRGGQQFGAVPHPGVLHGAGRRYGHTRGTEFRGTRVWAHALLCV